MLGIYLSEHPFQHAAGPLASLLTCSIVELNAELSGRDSIIAGLVAGKRSLQTKDGRTFIAAEIEDLTGSIEITVWPETYESTRDLWTEGNIIVASVRIRENNDRLQIAVNRATLFTDSFDPERLLPDPTRKARTDRGELLSQERQRQWEREQRATAKQRPRSRQPSRNCASSWTRRTTRTATRSG